MSGVMAAAISGKSDVVRYLINQGSYDITLLNPDENTPLHFACEASDKLSILILIIAGVDVDKKNKSGSKAGEGLMEIKTLINNIACEKEAFKVLSQD